jgi:hypothetical protein
MPVCACRTFVFLRDDLLYQTVVPKTSKFALSFVAGMSYLGGHRLRGICTP